MVGFAIRLLRRATRSLGVAFGGRLPDIAVTTLDAGGRLARLYQPLGSEAYPPVLFFHGGGYVSCDLDTHDSLCRQLAMASGLRFVSVDYRLAPEHPAPAQLDDALAACRWALAEPAALGGNSASIAVAGDSAGAYLAARCCAVLNGARRPVVAQLLLYPFLQMEPGQWSKPAFHPARAVGRVAAGSIRGHLGTDGYPPILSFDLTAMPPTVLVSGRALDPIRADAAAFAEQLRRTGTPLVHTEYPTLIHGAFSVSGLSRRWERAAVEAGLALRSLVTADGAALNESRAQRKTSC